MIMFYLVDLHWAGSRFRPDIYRRINFPIDGMFLFCIPQISVIDTHSLNNYEDTGASHWHPDTGCPVNMKHRQRSNLETIDDT